MHSALSKDEEAVALGWAAMEEDPRVYRDPQRQLGLTRLLEATTSTETPAPGAPSFWNLAGFLSTPENLRFEIRPPTAGHNCDPFRAQPLEFSILLPRLNTKLL